MESDLQDYAWNQGGVDKENNALLKLVIERPLYKEEDLRQLFQYEKPEISVIRNIETCIKPKSCKTCAAKMVPASHWLRKYDWRRNFMSDVTSGLTVAIMHIPQGMAYALLANVPPVVGIYMAFFPVLIYFFLGTSRHISMGTFAVVCLMTGRIVNTYSHGSLQNDSLPNNSSVLYSPMQVATTVTFTVGIIQLIMYVSRLGIICTLLSDTFVNGFTIGAAIHVLVSQVFDLLGLSSKRPRGQFKIIRTIIVIFSDIPEANSAATIISVIAIVLMSLCNELLKPWVQKKCCRFPIPLELIAVIAGTVISKYCNLPSKYEIETVGDIPTGIPKPEVPIFHLIPSIALESVAITMVSYTVTMSMSLIFAKKLNYDVDSNQELFAMGSSNIFGSFFSCLPVSASLSRSLIQQTVGGKTQLASIVSCLILLTILLWIGPFFEPLPRCILASIITVALKGMLLQAKEIVKFWKLSKFDAAVWIITLLTTVLFSIDLGLVIGLLASLATVLMRSVKPDSCLLGHVPNTDLYLDTSRYQGIVDLFGIKIFHYCGSLSFINRNQLGSQLYEKVGLRPRQVIKRRLLHAKEDIYAESNDYEDVSTVHCIIMDMSAVTYVDPSGVVALRDIVLEFAEINVMVYLAACSCSVFDTIQKCDQFEKNGSTFKTFATINDAVSYAQQERVSK